MLTSITMDNVMESLENDLNHFQKSYDETKSYLEDYDNNGKNWQNELIDIQKTLESEKKDLFDKKKSIKQLEKYNIETLNIEIKFKILEKEDQETEKTLKRNTFMIYKSNLIALSFHLLNVKHIKIIETITNSKILVKDVLKN